MASVTAPTAPQAPVAAAVHPVQSPLYITLAGSVMLLVLPSPTSPAQALPGLALVVFGVPVYHLWRTVEGTRPPPPPLPSH